jgi:hypothetical protein
VCQLWREFVRLDERFSQVYAASYFNGLREQKHQFIDSYVCLTNTSGISLKSKHRYRRADNFRPVSITVSAWEWVYATNLSRLQRETRERSKRHVGKEHSVLTTAILLPCCYWGKIVSLRTAQQGSAGQNLPSVLYNVHLCLPPPDHYFESRPASS